MQVPETIPANTIVGRSGIDAGPPQALPVTAFSSLVAFVYNNQVDNGTATGSASISVAAGPRQKLAIAGATTISFTGWPAPPAYAEVEIELINGGLGVTWPTINWLNGDGTTGTLFSGMGVTLQNPGTNFIIVWSRDGGTTIWGRAA